MTLTLTRGRDDVGLISGTPDVLLYFIIFCFSKVYIINGTLKLYFFLTFQILERLTQAFHRHNCSPADTSTHCHIQYQLTSTRVKKFVANPVLYCSTVMLIARIPFFLAHFCSKWPVVNQLQ